MYVRIGLDRRVQKALHRLRNRFEENYLSDSIPDTLYTIQIEAFDEYLGNAMLSSLVMGHEALSFALTTAHAEEVISIGTGNDEDLLEILEVDNFSGICRLAEIVNSYSNECDCSFMEAWCCIQREILPDSREMIRLAKKFSDTQNSSWVEKNTSCLFVRFGNNYSSILVE